VHFHRVRAVLQRVFLGDAVVGKLAQLSCHGKRHTEGKRDRNAKNKTAALDTYDDFCVFRLGILGEQVHGFLQRLGLLENRGDVLKHDPFLGEIGDVADVFLGEDFGHADGILLVNFTPVINQDRLVKLFTELCLINAPAMQELECKEYVKKHLQQMGLEVSEDDAAKKLGGNSNNVIAWLKGNKPVAPRIFLSAHLDTVEPTKGLVIEERDGVFYSASDTILGADDKGGMAPAIEAVQCLLETNASHGDVCLLFSVGEEIGLKGASVVDLENLNLDFGYVLDTGPPVGSFVTRTATHDKLDVTIIGKPAHAGKDPEKGINAIQVLATAVEGMRLGRIGPETTANIGLIEGGTAVNVVCAQVKLKAEARSTSVQELDAQVDHMVQRFEQAASQWGAQVHIKHERHYTSYSIPEESKVVQIALDASRNCGFEPRLRTTLGGSDANVYNAKGVPCIVVATGMDKIHTHDECISRQDLIDTARLAYEIVVEAAKHSA